MRAHGGRRGERRDSVAGDAPASALGPSAALKEAARSRDSRLCFACAPASPCGGRSSRPTIEMGAFVPRSSHCVSAFFVRWWRLSVSSCHGPRLGCSNCLPTYQPFRVLDWTQVDGSGTTSCAAICLRLVVSLPSTLRRSLLTKFHRCCVADLQMDECCFLIFLFGRPTSV